MKFVDGVFNFKVMFDSVVPLCSVVVLLRCESMSTVYFTASTCVVL